MTPPSTLSLEQVASKQLYNDLRPLGPVRLQSVVWHGRTCYYAKQKFSLFNALFCSIICFVGTKLIAAAHPIVGGLLIFAGLIKGLNIYSDFKAPSELEGVWKKLLKKDTLDDLPEISWEIDKKQNTLVSFTYNEMSQPIMALKIEKKTVAIAFKFLVQINNPENQDQVQQHAMVVVYDFNHNFKYYRHGDFELKHSLSGEQALCIERLLV